jgi:AbrB family looped-hinge helix DNA binding protein
MEMVNIGKVSVRGQVAIPLEIREKMHLKEGEKIIFVLEDNSLLMRKLNSISWKELTKHLRENAKKSGLKESRVSKIIEGARKLKTRTKQDKMKELWNNKEDEAWENV